MDSNTAILSPCGQYRYLLSRIWDENKPLVCFIMLNPSTADAYRDDATIRRCIGFATRWDYGGLYVVNLFAYRAMRPKAMKAAPEPIGALNDANLVLYAQSCARVVAAWGANGSYQGRNDAVKRLLSFREVLCLGLTKDGHPKHPLYVPYECELLPLS